MQSMPLPIMEKAATVEIPRECRAVGGFYGMGEPSGFGNRFPDTEAKKHKHYLKIAEE